MNFEKKAQLDKFVALTLHKTPQGRSFVPVNAHHLWQQAESRWPSALLLIRYNNVDPNSYKTKSTNRQLVKKEWIILDANDKVLGRLASQAASLIRGKHKPDFTPHVDCGDQVIIINAEKVRLTGAKETDKQYIRHTGYPGGQRTATVAEVREKFPIRILEHAVKGMLPKNRLGRQLFKNLFVYAGSEHPHAAQQPKTLA